VQYYYILTNLIDFDDSTLTSLEMECGWVSVSFRSPLLIHGHNSALSMQRSSTNQLTPFLHPLLQYVSIQWRNQEFSMAGTISRCRQGCLGAKPPVLADF